MMYMDETKSNVRAMKFALVVSIPLIVLMGIVVLPVYGVALLCKKLGLLK